MTMIQPFKSFKHYKAIWNFMLFRQFFLIPSLSSSFIVYAITYQINRPKLINHNSSVINIVLVDSSVKSMAGALLRLMRMEFNPGGIGVTAVLSVRLKKRPWKKLNHWSKVAGRKMRRSRWQFSTTILSCGLLWTCMAISSPLLLSTAWDCPSCYQL